MSLRDAAIKVLAAEGGPLHSKELTQRLLDQGLWQSAGKTPAATVAARLYTDIKKHGSASSFRQTAKNTFALNPDAASKPAVHFTKAELPTPAVASVAAAAAAPLKKRFSFTDAAEGVLRRRGDGLPMHYRDITERVLAEDLVKTRGKTPEATLYAQIITENARAERRGKAVRFIRHGKGLVGLAAWLEPGVQREIAKHNTEAEQHMLQQLRELDPADFEQLVGALLRALGIGDVEVTAYHGDKGIDATGVYELAPGLVVRLAVQAKRHKANVDRRVVAELNGSLRPNQQGLIITTSDFGKGSRAEAAREDKPLIWLINGEQLVKLLVANDIGARRVAVELVEPTGFELVEPEDTSG